MKKYILTLICLLTVTSQYSCKKFLNVTPVTKLSGNLFWQSSNDVEAFINDIYGQLWDKFSGASFIPAAGEFRMGEIKPTIGGRYNGNDQPRRAVYTNLALNDLKNAVSTGKSWSVVSTNATGTVVNFNFTSITKWAEFYTVIQASNILYSKVSEGVPGLSADDKNRYLAEAVFIRCFAYFTIVRLFGDVPYYTDAYHSKPLPRENFVAVLNKCIAELKAVRTSLPWKFDDPALNGVRANRGGATALLMNMNMWNAGFDAANRPAYYRETADLGNEVVQSNQYRLVPLSSFPNVMLTGSDEGLIEIKQGSNYALKFNKAAFPGEAFLTFPDKSQTDGGLYSQAYYTAAYLHKLYDSDPTDGRINSWFDAMFTQDGQFELKKFGGAQSPFGYPDWGFVFSRYADVILLRAEALAELGQNDDAIQMMNLVRQRAGAAQYVSGASATPLKDLIFLERCKELIGEGYHFYDLVRTGRVKDPTWCSNPLSAVQFDSGGWTWPIDVSAANSNPFMTFNQYWQ